MAEARYSGRAQPFLDAIAAGVFGHQAVRDGLLAGTAQAAAFRGARAMAAEQERLRPGTRQPFWANVFCGRDAACTCRVPGSRSLESDAVFVLEAVSGRRLALHVEFKHPGEAWQPGQAEGYPLRAACWADRARCPARLVPHDAWLCVVFCRGDESAATAVFDRVVSHAEAARLIPGWPSSAAGGRGGV
jgi:hypothetical protein